MVIEKGSRGTINSAQAACINHERLMNADLDCYSIGLFELFGK